MGEGPVKFCGCSISDHPIILSKLKQVSNDLIGFYTLVLVLYIRFCAILLLSIKNFQIYESVGQVVGGGGVDLKLSRCTG